MNDQDFYLKVAYALSGCQLVEEELKLYISEAFDLVRKCVGGRMAFKLSGDHYSDSSLERLIEMFKNLSDNETLVSELRQFKNERNFLSHKGIAHCLDLEGELFYSTALEFQERLSTIQTSAEKLRTAVREEGHKFRGYLWFEDIPKKG